MSRNLQDYITRSLKLSTQTSKKSKVLETHERRIEHKQKKIVFIEIN